VDLLGEVAAAELSKRGVAPNHCVGAMKARARQGLFDAPLLEIARCADSMDADYDTGKPLTISGVMIPYLNASGEGYAGAAHFNECLVDELDLSSLDLDSESPPSFMGCAIHLVSGVQSLPERLASQFVECSIEQFSTKEQTTDGILELRLPADERVGLTVLKKVFLQRGSGRKQSALARGLPPQERALVSGVLDRLVSLGYLIRKTVRSTELVLPVRAKRAEALRVLENMSQGIPGYR